MMQGCWLSHICMMQAPFREQPLDPLMCAYNKSMSSVRVSVEWIFGRMLNALTCMYGNTTSQFFNLDPPDLNEYFV